MLDSLGTSLISELIASSHSWESVSVFASQVRFSLPVFFEAVHLATLHLHFFSFHSHRRELWRWGFGKVAAFRAPLELPVGFGHGDGSLDRLPTARTTLEHFGQSLVNSIPGHIRVVFLTLRFLPHITHKLFHAITGGF